MAKKNGYVISYLDDYAGCDASLTQATRTFNELRLLMKDLGLQLAEKKSVAPTLKIEWLGYEIDAREMSVAIPKHKLDQLVAECKEWMGKKHADRRTIQAIAGRLIYVSNCITPGRKFTTRILAALRALRERKWTTISEEFKADLQWFASYAELSNGIALISPDRDNIDIECDSSLQGGGGASDTHCYIWVYKEQHKTAYQAIHHLEAINILVAYNTLANIHPLQPANVTIWTDNMASSFALQYGKTKDRVLAACARELWLKAATFNHEIRIRHRLGVDIPLADTLSRAALGHTYDQKAKAMIKQSNLKEVAPVLNNYVFFSSFI